MMLLSKQKNINSEKITTRLQLKGYGTTRYQAEVITKNLNSVGKQGRAYAYAVGDVIVSMKDYLQRPRVQSRSRQTLQVVLQVLQQRLNNVIEVPFGHVTNPEINKLARQLTQVMSNTDSVLAELKATAATIKVKHQM